MVEDCIIHTQLPLHLQSHSGVISDEKLKFFDSACTMLNDFFSIL